MNGEGGEYRSILSTAKCGEFSHFCHWRERDTNVKIWQCPTSEGGQIHLSKAAI